MFFGHENVDENLARDKIYPMKLPARLLLAALTISIGFFTPIFPGKTSPAISHKINCCADMSVDGCQSCPMNTGATNSGSGSTCCAMQSVCLLLYFTSPTSLVTAMQMISTIGVINECATARAQRPPVPPPRILFS